MEDLVPIPSQGRTFAETRRLRLTDREPSGRLRLDTVARFLQEIAIDDVDETGWGAPETSGSCAGRALMLSSRSVADRSVELVTWCSGVATLAAGRRWSLTGDSGGRIEVESVWIHLDGDQRPARIAGFNAYVEAAGGRRVSARPELPDPPADPVRTPWPLRASASTCTGT